MGQESLYGLEIEQTTSIFLSAKEELPKKKLKIIAKGKKETKNKF